MGQAGFFFEGGEGVFSLHFRFIRILVWVSLGILFRGFVGNLLLVHCWFKIEFNFNNRYPRICNRVVLLCMKRISSECFKINGGDFEHFLYFF